jgi:hypothetical protein
MCDVTGAMQDTAPTVSGASPQSLIGAKKSLLSPDEIPVPSSRDFVAQNIENKRKIRRENRPKGAFSCKIPVKIPVSRDLQGELPRQ